MYNLAFDSDALIKLAHSGILVKVCASFNCFTTSKVKEETVDEGKKRLYPDADIIDEILERGLIKVRNPRNRIISERNLGKGELSILGLCKSSRNIIVVSDDQMFISHLEKEYNPFLTPVGVIVLLRKLKKISLSEALHHLEYIKVFIRIDVYKSAKEDLEDD